MIGKDGCMLQVKNGQNGPLKIMGIRTASEKGLNGPCPPAPGGSDKPPC